VQKPAIEGEVKAMNAEAKLSSSLF
jgi:hypothetical protein